ncbi:MAG: hypothetical protein ACRCXQ_06385 [Vagococcus fluvialis]
MFTNKKNNKNTISLSVMFDKNFDDDHYKIKIAENSKEAKTDNTIMDSYLKIIKKSKNLILNSPISVIKLTNHTLDEVIKIFSNINTQGIKLSKFNLIHAKWSLLDDQEDLSIHKKFNFEERLNNVLNSFDCGYESIDKEVFVDFLYLTISDKGPLYNGNEKIGFPVDRKDSEKFINKFKDSV